MVKPGILVVADDASLRATLARWLLRAGYAVELAESPRRAHEVASKTSISLAMVAPQGLGAPGIELAHDLTDIVARVIMIGEPADNSGEAGEPAVGISLPLSEPDVLAKVRSVLRASSVREAPSDPQILRFEGYTLDAGARTFVDSQGQDVTLTRAEYSLLLAFAQKPGRVLSRDELTRVVTGRGAEPEDRSVDVLISRLRRKIEPDPKTPRLIVTVPGEGYRFTAKTQAVAATNEAAEVQGTELKTAGASDPPPGRQRPDRALRIFALAAALAAVVILAIVGWKAWSNRGALQQVAEASPPATSPESRPAAKPPQPVPSREEQRATVFKRMVAAMQDNQFNWRTVERLAVLSGVDESEAHEILAEHPNEVVLGKSQDGKLLAKLAAH
jgi:two-component system OmpR family response regulator